MKPRLMAALPALALALGRVPVAGWATR